MAGVATSKISVKVTGIGDTIETNPDWNTTTETVPTEVASGYIIHTDATSAALQLSALAPHIALAKMDMLYIKAEVGTIYVILDTAGTTTFGSASRSYNRRCCCYRRVQLRADRNGITRMSRNG
jgi:hypothetical protein